MRKKLLASVMTAAILTGTLSPALVSADEVPTLSLWFPALSTYTDAAVTEVEDALNAYAEEKYGFHVNLEYVDMGNFEQAINLAMTTDEIDVTCYFNGKLPSYAANGQLLDITNYFENASDDLKNVFTDAEVSASSVDGRMYGLVRKYQYGATEIAVMNKNIVEELGIDAKSITSMDDLEEVLYEVHEKYPDIYTMVPQSGAIMTYCIPVDRNIGVATFAYADMDSTELKSVFECDGIQEFCGYTSKWYKDGIIMPDALSNTMDGLSMVEAGSAFCSFQNSDIDSLETVRTGIKESGILLPARTDCTGIGNLQYGISANSAHPDEAFTLLSAMYTDPEFETILAYGIEGEHYVINEDGRADYPEGLDSTNDPYGGFTSTAVYPDYRILPVKEGVAYDDPQAVIDNWNESVAIPPEFGFYYDTSELGDFVTAYTNIENKYLNAVLTGSVALDDVISQIRSELESIGYYDQIADVQTALDEYLENK